MRYSSSWVVAALAIPFAQPYPAGSSALTASQLDNLNNTPIPGESSYYNDYRGKAPAFPASNTSPIVPTGRGSPGLDDLLFQNLLSAEWVVYSFYQQGVERFNSSSFVSAGFPNNTWDRIAEIRDNEAGHLKIFQEQISINSIKPGACEYEFGYNDTPESFLAFGTLLEISSMAFLSGLVLQAQKTESKGALLAIAATETRHEVWHLIDIWNENPFGGPSDTAFPYANEILDLTNLFIIPGSCPPENPVYPYPRQSLPQISYESNTTSLLPGSNITITYRNASHVPTFTEGTGYYAVFFHGLDTISVSYDVKTNKTVIPEEFERKGVIIVVIADAEGAPTLDSVVAGPLFILEQPVYVNALT